MIVATQLNELERLENIYQRGLQNGLQVTRLSQAQLREREPHVNGLEALLVPDAGIVNYAEVAAKLAEIIVRRGGEIAYGHQVEAIREHAGSVTVTAAGDTFEGRVLVNCAGLFSDRIAKLAGYEIGMKIVPFRGEYYVLDEAKPPGQPSYLPGAQPGLPVPRRAFHPHVQRQARRRPQCGAGLQTRRLPQVRL